MLVAGVDSSTQSTKVILCEAEDGTIVGRGSAPHPAGTECPPQAWWDALQQAGDRLLDRAAAVLTAPGSGVAGLHLFTFNQLQQAELWRRAALERTGIDKSLLAG